MCSVALACQLGLEQAWVARRVAGYSGLDQGCLGGTTRAGAGTGWGFPKACQSHCPGAMAEAAVATVWAFPRVCQDCCLGRTAGIGVGVGQGHVEVVALADQLECQALLKLLSELGLRVGEFMHEPFKSRV